MFEIDVLVKVTDFQPAVDHVCVVMPVPEIVTGWLMTVANLNDVTPVNDWFKEVEPATSTFEWMLPLNAFDHGALPCRGPPTKLLQILSWFQVLTVATAVIAEL